MTVTDAQQRILDYLAADASGDFVVVPLSVCNDIRPFDALIALGLIEGQWRPAKLPPGSYDMAYRAVSSQEQTT